MSESIERKKIREHINQTKNACGSPWKERCIMADMISLVDGKNLGNMIKFIDDNGGKVTSQQSLSQMVYLKAVMEGVRTNADKIMYKIDDQLTRLSVAQSLQYLDEEIKQNKKVSGKKKG